MTRSIVKGDVVQVAPTYVNPVFAGCLATVTEVRSWGVVGFVLIPGAGPTTVCCDLDGRAWLRIGWEHCELVGHAAWMPDEPPTCDEPEAT